MTPEQIERLRESRSVGVQALLAEWEERGREIAALRDEVVRLRHEVERRKGEVVAAEAKLAKVVELADHGIPVYAYGDHEAACEFAHRLGQILAAAEGE